MTISANEFKYMTEAIAADIAVYLSDEFKITVSEALDILYNSDTYSNLMNPETGLYFQSSNYVYSFLKDELILRKSEKY